MSAANFILIQAAAVLFMAVFLLKHALVGPQKFFARTSSISICLGLVSLACAEAQGDAASWAGALLIAAGMLIAIWMLLVAIYWVLFKQTKTQNL